MNETICTVSLSNGWLDNDYTFFANGKIEHSYDQHETKPNKIEFLDARQISESTKKKILEKCPNEHKERIKGILSLGDKNRT